MKLRIFISADIEGVNGVVHGEHQNDKSGIEFQRARKWMTREVNAAVEGLLAAGATEILVNDSHGSMRNILIEELHPAAELITGSSKPLCMMQGIDNGFDAAMFVGYHARAGNPGVLNHTISGSVANVRYNGVILGETGLNAAIAGYFGVPVIMVAGDNVVAQEAKELLGDIETAAGKTAITRYSARCLPLVKSEVQIRATAEKALKRHQETKCFKPFLPQTPIEVELEFHHSGFADGAARVPGVERKNATTFTFTAANGVEAFRGVYALISLGV